MATSNVPYPESGWSRASRATPVAGDHQADRHREPGADLGGEPAGNRGEQAERQEQRKNRDTGGERGAALHRLQVHRQQEQQTQRAEVHRRGHRARGRERGAPEESQGQHRIGAGSLDGQEGHQQHDSEHDRGYDQLVSPGVPGFDDGEDDGREQQHARAVRVSGLRLAALAHDPGSDDARDQHDRHVDDENRAPTDALHQGSAQQWAGGQSDAFPRSRPALGVGGWGQPGTPDRAR